MIGVGSLFKMTTSKMRLCLMTFLILLFLGCQWSLWFGSSSVVRLVGLKLQLQQQKQKNQQLAKRNHKLYQSVKMLRHDDAAIINTARSQLGLIGNSETLYLVKS